MIHRAPETVPPLFAPPHDPPHAPPDAPPDAPPHAPPDAPPENDAAPTGIGAGVNGPNTSPDSTFVRLPLTPPARRNAPQGTSDVAAGRIAGYAKDLRARVLAFIVEQGPHGATDDEGEAVLGIKPQTYTPRRGELVALGLVVDSGRRRNTASGRPAAVWATPNHSPASPKPNGGAA